MGNIVNRQTFLKAEKYRNLQSAMIDDENKEDEESTMDRCRVTVNFSQLLFDVSVWGSVNCLCLYNL